MESAKVRIQTSAVGPFPTTLRAAAPKICAEEGIKGFYKGYATELVYHCMYALFWMPLYQIVRESYGI